MRDILFGHPAGLLGRLGGRIMARQNQPLYTWTLSLLPVQTSDHVLEVGFGSGEAIHLLTKQTQAALIAGVDASPAMLSMAKKRNAAALLSGRVQLEQGSAEQLPFADDTFHKAFAINSVQLWSDRKAAIRELYRVLRPDGMLALTLQPHNAKTDQDFKAIGEQLLFDLTQIGFFNTELQIKEHTPTNILCALGRK
ncbi:class I SAM-dependent methyltransferase [Ktedonobacter robiniae]|uniref:Methyltransferase type 11 domain-containing protein n=1 Tax=Ktedonobacter robiniae TaxID=2778365 RepID=A0ABQ3UR63_9CHLR|nr:class I SAM-dependent methyltransferase [Ktedonobacter robiniae]GHO55192.1 hypothetical protein KSB_36670 [Ktedonobacter robiniae]